MIGTVGADRVRMDTSYGRSYPGGNGYKGSTYGPIKPGEQLGTIQNGDKTILIHNTGTGMAFPEPLMIPGIGPNGTTTVVNTKPV